MIFIIRHGERTDDGLHHEQAITNDIFDPPLTNRGYRQAVQSGLYIKEKIQELNLQGALILTSPFLRCIQTAQGISENIPVELIYISRGLGEFYKQNWFNRDVMEELTIYKETTKFQNFKEVNVEQVKQEYPETLQQFFGRFTENYKRIKDYFLDSIQEQNKALILVTHGMGIHVIMNLEKQFQYMQHIHYCSITLFNYKLNDKSKSNKFKPFLMFHNYSNHLIDPSL